MIKVLYISHDGMTDPLGQSQVIPYLCELSKKGFSFHLLSCEKKAKFEAQKINIKKILTEHNITWHPVSYTKNPPVISTLWDISRMKRKAFSLHKKEKFSIVHCRSYIASLIGLHIKKKTGVKFIFDMRGFWADERVEGGLWNMNNPLYKIIYRYFKSKEIEFLTSADYTVSLTEAAKNELHSWKNIPNQPIPIQVIPCCVDTEFFSREKITGQQLPEVRLQLKISENDFIISYLGAIGTWYLLDEMLLFFKILLKQKPNAKFLFITHENQETILQKAKSMEIPSETILIQKAERHEVPALLSLSKVSIFFIKNSFSKKASSPTKLGEIMAMGIPVICNSGTGDVNKVFEAASAGIALEQLNSQEFEKIMPRIETMLAKNNSEIRNMAIQSFSLAKGIESYHKIYTIHHNAKLLFQRG